MIINSLNRRFIASPNAKTRKQSAVVLVKELLAVQQPLVLEQHIRELLGVLVWKITEADGKYNTRHQSLKALECVDKSLLRHDHVYPRKKLIDEILSAKLLNLNDVIDRAIGCTVTKEEHSRLSRFDDTHIGWDRYRQARVPVLNIETGIQEILCD